MFSTPRSEAPGHHARSPAASTFTARCASLDRTAVNPSVRNQRVGHLPVGERDAGANCSAIGTSTAPQRLREHSSDVGQHGESQLRSKRSQSPGDSLAIMATPEADAREMQRELILRTPDQSGIEVRSAPANAVDDAPVRSPHRVGSGKHAVVPPAVSDQHKNAAPATQAFRDPRQQVPVVASCGQRLVVYPQARGDLDGETTEILRIRCN